MLWSCGRLSLFCMICKINEYLWYEYSSFCILQKPSKIPCTKKHVVFICKGSSDIHIIVKTSNSYINAFPKITLFLNSNTAILVSEMHLWAGKHSDKNYLKKEQVKKKVKVKIPSFRFPHCRPVTPILKFLVCLTLSQNMLTTQAREEL